MPNKPILTTFEAAALCNVSYNTIKNWIKRDLLSAYRTAGGHLRIRVEDLEAFSKEYGIPIYRKDDPGLKKILILDNDGAFGKIFTDTLQHHSSKIEIHTTPDPFEAGMLADSVKPDLMVLNPVVTGVNAMRICSRIRKTPSLKHIKIAILTDSSSQSGSLLAKEIGADFSLSKPYDKVDLLEAVEPIIMPKRGVRGGRRKANEKE